ncbi:MAG TPA: hypothetical protein VJM33_18975, partial [Microthrixaceae bacterium]|nr:hypothetical protein [Microthrixaceae bacterium]
GVARVPVLGTAITIGTGVALARRLDFLDQPLVESMRLVVRGHAGSGELISRALIRPWFPLTIAAATRSRRARRVLLLSAIVPPLVEWSRSGRNLDPARFVALSLADDVAYSVGVWKGCVRDRSIGALLPRLRSWPGAAGAAQREPWAAEAKDR